MRSFLLASVLFIVSSATVWAEEPVLRVAIDAPYPPFAYHDKETGKLTGFDYDIAVALCEQIQRKCDISTVAFDEIIPQIVNEKIDIGVAGMAKNPEREKLVLFSDKYFRSSSIFVEMIGNNEISLEGLKGKKIAVQSGTTQETYLRTTYGSVAEIVPLTSFNDIITATRTGKVDVAFIDGLPGYNYLNSSEGEGMDLVGEPLKLGEGSCIVLNKSLEKERDAINQAIQDLRSSGKYDTINRKYFEFSVY